MLLSKADLPPPPVGGGGRGACTPAGGGGGGGAGGPPGGAAGGGGGGGGTEYPPFGGPPGGVGDGGLESLSTVSLDVDRPNVDVDIDRSIFELFDSLLLKERKCVNFTKLFGMQGV